MNNKYKRRGFTLIELMVVVAIVGILSALAYPNYRQYVLRAHRTEGGNALIETATQQERYFSNNSKYAPDMATLGYPSPLTRNGYYSISIAPCAGGALTRCYVLTATAQGNQTADKAKTTGASCTPLTLDSTGAKTPAACWD